MRMLVLGITALSLVLAATAEPVHHNSTRADRGLFTFITISKDSCTTLSSSYRHGTCYAAKDCKNLGGVASGTCAQGFGVCCYFLVTCGGTVRANRTHFVSTTAGSTTSAGATTTAQSCTANVDLIGNNVCQLRLDFHRNTLNQPNPNGVCNLDNFQVYGTESTALPQLCGINDGQHMYVDVDSRATNVRLNFDLSNAATGTAFSRQWDVEVTQIKCDSVQKAPTGCLQYHNTTSGTITSFNYAAATETQLNTGTGIQYHLANQHYRVCLKKQTNYCSIEWTPTSARSFVMTGGVVGQGDQVGLSPFFTDAYTGLSHDGTGVNTDGACVDYVIIPGGSYAGIAAAAPNPEVAAGQSDRYCGATITTVTSNVSPFQLDVVTNGLETASTGRTNVDTANIGFSLRYRMLTTGCP